MKRLILTPNKEKVCGMYQIAKDLDGDVVTLPYKNPLIKLLPLHLSDEIKMYGYDEVITLLYPMHLFGRDAKKLGIKWICYDMKVPPAKYFKSFWRRQYMKLFYKLNEWSKKGADEYWELSEYHPKPRWTEKSKYKNFSEPYALYLGRTTDYKNFEWLKKTMDDLNIPLKHPDNVDDERVHILLSHATLLVTASEWEGYGRPVLEAQALGIPVVAYDVGTHKKNIKKGICVPLGNEEVFKESVRKVWDKYAKNQTRKN